VRGLHVLGPLLRAQLWKITAVPEPRVAARTLARQLLLSGWLATAGGGRDRHVLATGLVLVRRPDEARCDRNDG
jgi:hypothetical protein